MDNLKTIKPRVATLDSLRGLASVSVVIAHFVGCVTLSHTIDEYLPTYIIRAAHEAVIFFFILSGYVLVYQHIKEKKFNYINFLVKRFFRIYIPYIVAIALSILLYQLFNSQSIKNSPTWIGHNWNSGISLKLILQHITLVTNFNTDAFDPVIWSLVHEMRFSIIFPLLLFALRLNWKTLLLICAALSLLVGLGLAMHYDPSHGYKNSMLYSIHYFSMFTMGGVIAKYQNEFELWYLSNVKKYKYLFMILALLAYNYSHLIAATFEDLHKLRILAFSEVIEDWVTSIAACYLIIAAIAISKRENWLATYIPLKLGEISYSLYLVHVPIILTVYSLLSPLNIYLILFISLIISFLAALIFNKIIEKNSAKYGRKIANFVDVSFARSQ